MFSQARRTNFLRIYRTIYYAVMRNNELSVPSEACESRVSMAFESESVLFLFVSALFLFYALSDRRPTLSRSSRARVGNERLLQ